MLKILSTKSEIRNKSKIQNKNDQNNDAGKRGVLFGTFGFWLFEFVSDLDIRI